MILKRGNKILTALIIILAIPLIGFLIWTFGEKKPLQIMVMNKSVVTGSRVEHKAAFWTLNYNRYVKSTGQAYDHRKDYYGFFPLRPYRNKEYNVRSIMAGSVDSLVNQYDMAWFIDTYGLSFGEWIGDDSGINYSRMLYGGLNQEDFQFISGMLGQNKMVIAEFNFFASPTSDSLRARIEELSGMHWSGWTGLYYDNLDDKINRDLPSWIVNLYREQNDGQWPFTKPGIILVSHENRVVVLENETHIDIEVPLITTIAEKAGRYGLSPVVHYPCRFEISYASDTSSIISYFEIYTNSSGDSLLEKNNIPSRFPAVTVNMDNGPFYYLSGSFSHYNIPAVTSRFSGFRSFDFIMHSNRVASKGSFFSEYYYPLIANVIADYYVSLEDVKQ